MSPGRRPGQPASLQPATRRRQSEMARLLGLRPWQLRRARYLISHGDADRIEAEDLTAVAAWLRRHA